MSAKLLKFKIKVGKIIDGIDGLKPNSKKSYKSHLSKLFSIVNPSTITFNFLKDVDTIKSIVDKETDSTAKMIYISIYRVLEKVPGMKGRAQQYKELSLNITRRLNDKATENVIEDKRQGRMMKFNQLKKVVKQLKTNYTNSSREIVKNYYLVGLLYILNPFTPRLEYANMKIIKNKSEDNGSDNFLLINGTWKVILNDYKTFGKYGKMVVNVPKVLVKEMSNIGIDNQEFVFQKGSKGYSRKTFSQFIKNAMKSVGLNLGLNEIRIIKESHLQSQASYKKLSSKQQDLKHIKLFLHSSGIARSAYRKTELLD